MREVIVDIETIPCERSLWKRLSPELQEKFLRDTTEDEAWRSTALDPALGRIVCIGFLSMQNDNKRELVRAGPKEAELLREFWKLIREDDYIVGHNVLSFDLPFIRARSVACKVKPSRQFDLRRYTTNSVYDTMQVWSNWEMRRAPKLDLLAISLELGKKAGTGSRVYEWYAKRNWKRIKAYCSQDLRLTHDIYRRMTDYGL